MLPPAHSRGSCEAGPGCSALDPVCSREPPRMEPAQAPRAACAAAAAAPSSALKGALLPYGYDV